VPDAVSYPPSSLRRSSSRPVDLRHNLPRQPSFVFLTNDHISSTWTSVSPTFFIKKSVTSRAWLAKSSTTFDTVSRWISAVEGVYRTRRLAVLAGENRTETTHTENECRFKLDLERVYFNPRLAGERNRVASQTAQSEKTEEIIDMFAGVGPFAIQIAKRAPKSHFTAIDINPDAIRYLKENVGLNHVQNVDAVVGDVKEIYGTFRNTADRIIMNLPKSAYLFLGEALSMLKPSGGIIHFYDLESAYPEEGEEKHDALERALEQAKERLLGKIEELDEELRSVEIQEARKVKPYAPYAYIIGVDARIKEEE
jgi:tRNA (guanine37-N1)-methyltransferase